LLHQGAVNITYDGDGNRVSETSGGLTTQYLIDDVTLTGYSQVMDELVNGSVTRTYAYGLALVSEDQLLGGTPAPSFYGYDGHGNVRFLTSSTGTVTDTYQSDAFGNQIASTGGTPNNFLFSGEQFDNALNFYYLRARYFNPVKGRFETMDPEQGNINNPGSLNKYVYTQNNPVNASDPTGRQELLEYGLELTHYTELAYYSHKLGNACGAQLIQLATTALQDVLNGQPVDSAAEPEAIRQCGDAMVEFLKDVIGGPYLLDPVSNLPPNLP
jgi:RHS repeat-associated protein